MQVAVLGSGSRGNAILLCTGDTKVLVDAGFSLRTLGKRASRIGMALEDLDALILTHEHQDHARGAAQLAALAECPVYLTGGTLAGIDNFSPEVETNVVTPGETFRVGAMEVLGCVTSHDAREPMAMRMTDASGTCVGIAQDVGAPSSKVRDILAGCDCVLVEANHDEAMLARGPYPLVVRRRIAGPRGHLSNGDTAALMAQIAEETLRYVVLVHLSDKCNSRDRALDAVGRALRKTAFKGKLLAADQSGVLGPLEITARTGQLAFQGLD